MNKRPIFISYSWDSPEHSAWVKKFSVDLQTLLGDYYEVLLDQNLPKGYPIHRFIKLGIERSVIVLVILTTRYKALAEAIPSSNEAIPSSNFVAFEYSLIRDEINKNIDSAKFIPILRNGNFAEAFSLELKGRIGVDFRVDDNYEDNLRQLANDITKKERIPSIIKFMHGLRTKPTDKGIAQTNVDNKNLTNGDSAQSNENTQADLEEHQDRIDHNTFETTPNKIYTKSVTNVLNHSISGVEYSDDKKKLISVPKDSKDTFIILDYVTEIGDSAFEDCTNLISIVIPKSVTKIGRNAFRGCAHLFSLIIPRSVTKIGDNAFENCTSLISIMIPQSVTEIGSNFFRGCVNLLSLAIPNSVTKIGDNAFENCTSLISIMIPQSVTEIGSNFFRGCVNLLSLAIPNSVTKIGDNAFESCTGLISIMIPESVTEIGEEAFLDCTKLTSILIPKSVTKIGNGAFSGCSSLTSILIPRSVNVIGRDAFEDCTKLSSIVIPNSVNEIGRRAFDCCTNLEKIYFKHETPISFSENAFRGIEKSKVTLCVPLGSRDAYRNSEYYQGFKDIIEEE